MEPLTWTGALSGLNIVFYTVVGLLALAIVLQILAALLPSTGGNTTVNPCLLYTSDAADE